MKLCEHQAGLRGGRGGASSIEFALSLPLLFMILIGCSELYLLVSEVRKISQAANAIAEIGASYSAGDDLDLAKLDNIANALMFPKSKMDEVDDASDWKQKYLYKLSIVAKDSSSGISVLCSIGSSGLADPDPEALGVNIEETGPVVVAEISSKYSSPFVGSSLSQITERLMSRQIVSVFHADTPSCPS